MIDIIPTFADRLLGLGSDSLSLWQMALRALVVYLVAIIMVRLGDKRFIGKSTALDVILGFMLGSILSRAITGSSPFFPTLGAAVVLVMMHWAFAVAAFRWSRFGTLVKGRKRQLVRDGHIEWGEMKAGQISHEDLLSALRAAGGGEDLDQVDAAYLERSGDISVIKRTDKPRIVEIRVDQGVQTVRVELG